MKIFFNLEMKSTLSKFLNFDKVSQKTGFKTGFFYSETFKKFHSELKCKASEQNSELK